MDLSNSILGSSIVQKLQARVKAPLLTIGSDHFSRRDFARMECFNFAAAVNLDYLINHKLDKKPEDTRDLYFNFNPHLLALPRMGAISLATLSAAFEAKGLGGESPLETWLRKHEVQIFTWGTLKDREAEEARAERKRLRDRKHVRRNMAHGARVARFEVRSKAS